MFWSLSLLLNSNHYPYTAQTCASTDMHAYQQIYGQLVQMVGRTERGKRAKGRGF